MNEKFLDAFRALDTELKEQGTTVIDYENSLNGTKEYEKLKVCRIMRNYMSHNDTTFLSTTNEQIKFLDGLTNEILQKSHIVGQDTKKLKPVKSTEPIKNIIAALDKYPIVVIDSPLGLYLVDKDILVHNLALGNKKIAIPKKLPKYNYINKVTKVDKLNDGTYIVIDSDDKYFGIYKKGT